jgi:hypothetical protein
MTLDPTSEPVNPAVAANLSPPDCTRRNRLALAGILLAVPLAGLCAWLGAKAIWKPPPPMDGPHVILDETPTDPRLSYAGPFRNIQPKIQYVGDAKCADCHFDLTKSFAKHPMGRSTLPIKKLARSQQYGKEFRNPFHLFNRFQARIEREGDLVRHKIIAYNRGTGSPVAELTHPVHYGIGSGHLGFSYLEERDGYVYQTPISWFTQKKFWDVSPNFGPSLLTGRKLTAACLFCHANHVNEMEGYDHRFKEPIFQGHSIGCERCHGPGEVHVREREGGVVVPGWTDFTIVNPKKLPNPKRLARPKKWDWHLREAVCQQCHLEGEARIVRQGRKLFDFRPGMALDDFWAIYVHSHEGDEERKAVSHVEQMYQGKCFQNSKANRKMGCLTCHNPHVFIGPDKRLAHYRAKCLTCHETHQCKETKSKRQAKQDSCVDCHMPRQRAIDIAHAAMTNHQIVRKFVPGEPVAPINSDQFPLVNFYKDKLPGKAAESPRDLAVGLAFFMAHRMDPSARPPQILVEQAIGRLDDALAKAPLDHEAWRAKAQLLLVAQRPAEALVAFEAMLEFVPNSDWALRNAAGLARDLGQEEKAVRLLKRAVKANPYDVANRRELAGLLRAKGDWSSAKEQAKSWIRLDPFSVAARWLLVESLVRDNQKAQANTEFKTIRGLSPPNMENLEVRFDRLMRN